MIVIAITLILALGGAVVALTSRGLPVQERKWIGMGALAALIGSLGFILVLFNVYGSGDLFVYERLGQHNAQLLREDFGRYFPMTVQAFLQRPTSLDPWLFSPQSSTASMVILSCWLFFILGDSLVMVCLAGALMAFTGRLAIYMALRKFFGSRGRFYLSLASFWTPSAIFWMGGLVKEALACAGMGWLVWGSFQILQGHKILSGTLMVLLGGLLAIMVKPYILLPMGLAIGVFFVLERARLANRSFLSLFNPLNLTIATVLTVGMTALVGTLAPQMSVDNLAEETARLQSYGSRSGSGSNYTMGDSSATSASQQAVFAPIALFSSLFRPLFFEVHNAPALLSGLEMLFAQFAFIFILRRHGIRGLGRIFFRVPAFGFMGVFVLFFATGVGLGTTNMGTLSRYRVPMMQAYFFLLIMLMKTPKGAFKD